MSNFDITEDKKPILDLIEKSLYGKRLIIVEAPPGAGKTFLCVLCAKKLIETRSIGVNQKVLSYCLTSKSYHKRIVASTKILPSKLSLTSKSEHRLGLLNCILNIN